MPRLAASLDQLRVLLGEAGLPPREIEVYLALLQLRSGKVSALARAVGFKRVGVYQLLAALERRGLVTHLRSGRATEFVPKPLKAVVDLFAHQATRAAARRNEAIGLHQALSSLVLKKGKSPRVSIYHGRDRMADLYAEVFSHEFVAIFNPTLMYRLFDRSSTEALFKTKPKLRGRELVVPGPGVRRFADAHPQSKHFRFRVLPMLARFDVDMAVFGDTVTLFCYDPELTVIRLDSTETAVALRSAFTLLWELATPYPPKSAR